jgi:hypothetical protein
MPFNIPSITHICSSHHIWMYQQFAIRPFPVLWRLCWLSRWPLETVQECEAYKLAKACILFTRVIRLTLHFMYNIEGSLKICISQYRIQTRLLIAFSMIYENTCPNLLWNQQRIIIYKSHKMYHAVQYCTVQLNTVYYQVFNTTTILHIVI